MRWRELVNTCKLLGTLVNLWAGVLRIIRKNFRKRKTLGLWNWTQCLLGKRVFIVYMGFTLFSLVFFNPFAYTSVYICLHSVYLCFLWFHCFHCSHCLHLCLLMFSLLTYVYTFVYICLLVYICSHCLLMFTLMLTLCFHWFHCLHLIPLFTLAFFVYFVYTCAYTLFTYVYLVHTVYLVSIVYTWLHSFTYIAFFDSIVYL